MTARTVTIALLLLAATVVAPGTARADGCDALSVRMIRATGASLAGRTGALVVFHAADAARMSLVCGRPNVVLVRSASREPIRPYFILIGLAGQALTGASPGATEDLALRLHQATLLTGAAQSGRAGPLAMRCEPGDRPDGFHEGALCRIAAARDKARGTIRRRAGLPGDRPPG